MCSAITAHKFLPNLHSRNTAALPLRSLNEPDNLGSLTTAHKRSGAQSCFHLYAAISMCSLAELLRKGEGRVGGTTLSRNSILIIV